MTLRRYAPMRRSTGTVIPLSLRREVLAADQGRCVGPLVGMPGECFGSLELDHVRASGGISMKSSTSLDNLVAMCSTHHRVKTEAGREWRPRLLRYVANR